METNQPKWELVANLGDANPIDYGGYLGVRAQFDKLMPIVPPMRIEPR